MFWTFSGTGVQLLIQLFVLVTLSRLLTPADFGLMGAAAVVIAFSQIVSQMGVGPALIQRRELHTEHIRVGVTLSCSLGCLLGALVYFAAPAISTFYRMPDLEPVLRGVAFLFPLDGVSTVAKSLLSRELRFRQLVALEVLSYLIGYGCVGVLLAWQGYGVWALVVANLTQATFRMVAMYLATKHPVQPSLNLTAGRQLLSFGLGHSMAQLGTVVSQQGDNLVVGRWLGAAALGIYGRAYNLMVLPATAFGRIINRVLFPVMAQVQDEPDRLAGSYERALALVALISLPVSVVLWVVAPEFIPLLLGSAWISVVLPFRLFTVGLWLRMSGKISDVCANAAGAVYARAFLQGTYAALVVLGAIIGQRWGIGGVAVAVSIAMAINWLAMAALSHSVTGLPWPRFVQAQLPGVFLAVVIGLAVFLAAQGTRAADLGNVPTLIVATLTAGTVAAAAVSAWPQIFLGTHGRWALRQAEELIRRRTHRGKPVRPPSDEAVGKADLVKANSE
jgi:PST family polysaccharide transporter